MNSTMNNKELYRKIKNISDYNYNKALDLVNISDISGAIECLRKSIQFDKKNYQARNLLGLLYYHIGEYVNGMAQWVISMNQQPKDNIANHFMKELKREQDDLDKIDNNIRKYNSCIGYINDEAYDLAAIELGHVISNDETWIRPMILQGILFLREGQYVKARKPLRQVLKIDKGNIKAKLLLNIMKRDNFTSSSLYDSEKSEQESSYSYSHGNETIIQPQDSSSVKIAKKWLYIGATALITFIISWVLILPARIKSQTKANRETIKAYQEELQAIGDEKNKLEEQEKQKAKAEADAKKNAKKNFEMLSSLKEKIDSKEYKAQEVFEELSKIDKNTLTEEAREIYNYVASSINDTILSADFANAYQCYTSGDYSKAIGYYEKVVAIDENYQEGAALYQLAVSYQNTKQNDKAKSIYEKIVNNFSNSEIGILAKSELNAMQK